MKKILIVTGGSGGHVIPSLSIYDILKENFEVQIATDLRGSKYINNNDYNFSLIDVPNLFSSDLITSCTVDSGADAPAVMPIESNLPI